MSSIEWGRGKEWEGVCEDYTLIRFKKDRVYIGSGHDWEGLSFDDILDIAEKIKEIRNERD
jgi:hypothetical protein